MNMDVGFISLPRIEDNTNYCQDIIFYIDSQIICTCFSV